MKQFLFLETDSLVVEKSVIRWRDVPTWCNNYELFS